MSIRVASIRVARHALLSLLTSCTLAVLAGCAPITPSPASVPPPAAPPAARAPGTPTPGAGSAAVQSDSLPSPEAERVLASIPEPISGSQLVPPDSARRRSVVAPEAAYDTLRATSEEGGASAVPVPGPSPATAAPVVTFATPQSTAPATPAAAAPSSSAPAAAAPSASAPATSTPSTASGASAPAEAGAGAASAPASGPCWRVQVAAPTTREEADARLDAAQSLLVVKMMILPEKGLFKVRTDGCMSREVAETMKRRALDSGFDGSFLVDTAPPAKAAPPKKKPAGKSR